MIAGLATVCEVIGFYDCGGGKADVAAHRAAAHLVGRRRRRASPFPARWETR